MAEINKKQKQQRKSTNLECYDTISQSNKILAMTNLEKEV